MPTVKVKTTVLVLTAFLVASAGYFFVRGLMPVATEEARIFEITKGESAFNIISRLRQEGLVRSSAMLKIYVLVSATVDDLKPGTYNISAGLTAPAIIRELIRGPIQEAQLRIVEGATVYDIDKILSSAGVLDDGEFLMFAKDSGLEGMLFPDTYSFYLNSSPRVAADVFLKNFDTKVTPLFTGREKDTRQILILASLLEKEVPDFEEQKIVAGILLRRFKVGMPLQVDATVCYAKKEKNPEDKCDTLTALDLKLQSAYNTYIHVGWPPGPIANPGIQAIRAALAPVDSDYWYYLSDPKTQKTIFSKTLDSHKENKVKYIVNT